MSGLKRLQSMDSMNLNDPSFENTKLIKTEPGQSSQVSSLAKPLRPKRTVNTLAGAQSNVDMLAAGAQSNVVKPAAGAQSNVVKPLAGAQSNVFKLAAGAQSNVVKLATGAQSNVDMLAAGAQSNVVESEVVAAAPFDDEAKTNDNKLALVTGSNVKDSADTTESQLDNSKKESLNYDSFSDSESENIVGLSLIEDLDKESETWSFRGRCVLKSALRSYTSKKGNTGHVFALDFKDMNPVTRVFSEIRVTCFTASAVLIV